MAAIASPPVVEPQTSWFRNSLLCAALICALVLGPAAVVIAVTRGMTGWPLAVYVAGFASVCLAGGAWAKHAVDATEKDLIDRIDAAEAGGASPSEIFDLIHEVDVRPNDARNGRIFFAVVGLITAASAFWLAIRLLHG